MWKCYAYFLLCLVFVNGSRNRIKTFDKKNCDEGKNMWLKIKRKHGSK